MNFDAGPDDGVGRTTSFPALDMHGVRSPRTPRQDALWCSRSSAFQAWSVREKEWYRGRSLTVMLAVFLCCAATHDGHVGRATGLSTAWWLIFIAVGAVMLVVASCVERLKPHLTAVVLAAYTLLVVGAGGTAALCAPSTVAALWMQGLATNLSLIMMLCFAPGLRKLCAAVLLIVQHVWWSVALLAFSDGSAAITGSTIVIAFVSGSFAVSIRLVRRLPQSSTAQSASPSDRAALNIIFDAQPNDGETTRALLQIHEEELEVFERLGAGSFGDVFRGNWHGKDVAVKMMFCSPQWSPDVRASHVKAFTQEVQAMAMLRHPNVTLFMGACTSDKQLIIVTEFVRRGSLWDVLRKQHLQLNFDLRRNMLVDAALGMNYLHHRGVSHGDLKTPNLLVTNHFHVKVADFSMADWSQRNASRSGLMQGGGSLLWTAPEVFLGVQVDAKCSDVYSFGICMWEVLTREVPFEAELHEPASLQMRIMDGARPGFPKRLSAYWQDLVSRCWHHDPKQRPDFDEILETLRSRKLLRKTSVSLNHSHSRSSRLLRQANTANMRAHTFMSHHESSFHENASELDASLREQNTAGTLLGTDTGGMASLVGSRSRGSSVGDAPLTPAHLTVTIEGSLSDVSDAHTPALNSSTPSFQSFRRRGSTDNTLHKHKRVVFESGSGTPTAAAAAAHKAEAAAAFGAEAEAKYATTGGFVEAPPIPGHERVKAYGTDPMHLRDSVGSGGRYSVGQRFSAGGGDSPGPSRMSRSTSGPPSTSAGTGSERVGEITGEGSGEGAGEGAGEGSGEAQVIFETGHMTQSMSEMRRKLSSRRTGSSSGSGHPMWTCGPGLLEWLLDPLDITILERIGGGAAGAVYRGSHQGRDVAIKTLSSDVSMMRKAATMLEAELQVIGSVVHPNIVELVGILLDPPLTCVVLELMSGSLTAVLQHSGVDISWPMRVSIALDAARGMQALHSQGFIHRDLKSMNLLLNSEWTCKVADFGFSRLKAANVTLTRVGTPAWVAPEVILGHRYNEKVDCYSFGIVLWELVTRQYPYHDIEHVSKLMQQVVNEGFRPPIPELPSKADNPTLYKLQSQFHEIMVACWGQEPESRPSFDVICEFLALLQHTMTPSRMLSN